MVIQMTSEQILAIQAVCYGCNTNKRLIGGKYFNRKTKEMISFESALEIVYELLDAVNNDNNDGGGACEMPI